MPERKKVQNSLDRYVFSNNPFNEKILKEKMMEKVTEHQPRGGPLSLRHRILKPALSAVLLIAAATCFMFFVSQSSQHQQGGSSASWAYPFVKFNGKTYVITGQTVSKVGKQLGIVTSYSDIEAADQSGNFSNEFKKGSKMFSIPGVDFDKGIAVQKENGTYVKAVARGIWEKSHLNKSPKKFAFADDLVRSLQQYKEIKVQNVGYSVLHSILPKSQTVEIDTNLGMIDAAVYPKKADVSIQDVSSTDIPGRYNYHINGKLFTSTDEHYFIQYDSYFLMTDTEELADILNAEKVYTKNSVMKNTPWKVSPSFDLRNKDGSPVWNDPDHVQGIKNKIAILKPLDLVAKDKTNVSKMYWYVWGDPDKLIGKPLTAVAVHKDSGSKFILDRVTLQGPVYGEDASTLTSFSPFPSKGLWRIDVLIGGKYFDSIVVYVKAPYIQTKDATFLVSGDNVVSGKLLTSDPSWKINEVELMIHSELNQKQIPVKITNKKDPSDTATFTYVQGEKFEGSTSYTGQLKFDRPGKWKINVLGEKTVVNVKSEKSR